MRVWSIGADLGVHALTVATLYAYPYHCRACAALGVQRQAVPFINAAGKLTPEQLDARCSAFPTFTLNSATLHYSE